MALFRTNVDPETNLIVCSKAMEIGRDVHNAKFRRGLLKRNRKPVTVYDEYGNPVAQIKVNDVGSTMHEFDAHQDAVARPFAARPKE